MSFGNLSRPALAAAFSVFCSAALAGPGLYQQHDDGSVWHFTGVDCSGNDCGHGWTLLDTDTGLRELVAARAASETEDHLYKRNVYSAPPLTLPHPVFGSTGISLITPTGLTAPIDNNPHATQMAAGGDDLYQLHDDGQIWKHVRNTICNVAHSSCNGTWTLVDSNPMSAEIAADELDIVQRHTDGTLWHIDDTTHWTMIDNNRDTVHIAVSGGWLYQMHNDHSIWAAQLSPTMRCTPAGDCSTLWVKVDGNPDTVAIAAGPVRIAQLHADGSIWVARHSSGTLPFIACGRETCIGWDIWDNNSHTKQIAIDGANLYQRHDDGTIWRSTDHRCAGDDCSSGWVMIDNNPRATSIVGSGR